MYKIITIISLFISSVSFATNILDVDEVSIDAFQIKNHRDAYFFEDENSFKYGGTFNLNVRALTHFFLENHIHLRGTDSQIREGSWEFRAGANMSKYWDIFYYHHSKHVMERYRAPGEFPIDDFYGVRFYFFRKGSL